MWNCNCYDIEFISVRTVSGCNRKPYYGGLNKYRCLLVTHTHTHTVFICLSRACKAVGQCHHRPSLLLSASSPPLQVATAPSGMTTMKDQEEKCGRRRGPGAKGLLPQRLCLHLIGQN